jgi:hypothetical protein
MTDGLWCILGVVSGERLHHAAARTVGDARADHHGALTQPIRSIIMQALAGYREGGFVYKGKASGPLLKTTCPAREGRFDTRQGIRIGNIHKNGCVAPFMMTRKLNNLTENRKRQADLGLQLQLSFFFSVSRIHTYFGSLVYSSPDTYLYSQAGFSPFRRCHILATVLSRLLADLGLSSTHAASVKIMLAPFLVYYWTTVWAPCVTMWYPITFLTLSLS